MKCNHCSKELKIDDRTSALLKFCPFCGLAKNEEPKFYDNSKDALAAIMNKYGTDVLLEELKAQFPGFAPSVSKNVKRLIYAVYENNAAKILESNPGASQTDKEIAVKKAIQKLTEAFISRDMAETIIYELTDSLGWQIGKSALPPPSPTDTEIAAEIKKGERRNLQFGDYKWRVLDVQGDKALIITEDVVEQRCYSKDLADATWETCALRKYLNEEFYNRFNNECKTQITARNIPNPDSPQYGTNGGNDTQDSIFLLNIDEVHKYFNSNSDRVANHAGKACLWWLRSPGYRSSYAAYVRAVGYVDVHGDGVSDTNGGARPALWLNLSSEIF